MNDGRRTRASAHLPGEALRSWLRVPDGLALPGWAAESLAEPLREALAARDGRPLDEVCFGIVDLETTGVSRDARILEVGLVVRRGAGSLARFSSLIGVEVAVPPWITALTGIDPQDTWDAPAEPEALGRLAGLLRDHRVEVLVAHNAGFDRAFLERAWREHALEPALPPFVCSLRLARRWVHAPRYGLDTLAARLGIPVPGRHRALGDAEITSVLWTELLARGRQRGIHTLESLLALGTPGRSPRRRRLRVIGGPDRS